MRKEQLINDGWLFRYHDGTEYNVDIPHTWNNEDGQDGGDDYYRGTCFYEKSFYKIMEDYKRRKLFYFIRTFL